MPERDGSDPTTFDAARDSASLLRAVRDAEARLALIASVSESIAASDDPAELQYEVSRAVGEHLQARRCLFTEVDVANDRGRVLRDYCRGVASVAGDYRVSDYSETTRREMIAGRTVVNDDAKLDPRTARDYEKTYEPNGERAYVAVPLLRDGRWVAAFWISDDVPRAWSRQDVALAASLAERSWTAVEKLRVNTALRASEARMQFIGELAGVGYWDWDIAADTLYWSPITYRLHGLPEDEPITYERCLAVIHPDDRERVDSSVRSTQQYGGPTAYETEYRVVLPDDSVRWVQGRGSATFANGAPVRMAGIALDVTRRKLLELEREELFEREQQLRAEADEASLAKDHFLALLSHELRTPMTTILGWASFIRSGFADPATAQKGIESIEHASRTQSRLIDDLLDVSRIVTGKMDLDRKLLDVHEPVRSAIEVVLPAARAASITVVAHLGREPAFIVGDATRIQQVIWNLLSNAVKFTGRDGTITVSVTQQAETVEVRVRDTGVGIDPEFLPYVFDRFRQGENGPTRRYGGLGLGLSIVRYLTELHGGSVQPASEGHGRGAEFVVRLPRAVVATADAETSPAEPAADGRALDGVRVLVVDDDAASRDVIGAMLRGFGANVAEASSAAEAMTHFGESAPDVLVSDIGMPGEDGYHLIERLRAAQSRVPAVAVTAYADPKDRDRALDSGFHAHLSKPVDPHALVRVVLRVLAAA